MGRWATYVLGLLADAVRDALLEPLEVLVEVPLLLESEHCGGSGDSGRCAAYSMTARDVCRWTLLCFAMQAWRIIFARL